MRGPRAKFILVLQQKRRTCKNIFLHTHSPRKWTILFFIVFYSLSFCSLHHSLASTTFSFTKWKCPFSQFLCVLFVWSPLKIATFMTNNNIDNDDRRTNRYILVTYLCHFFRYLLACCMNNVVLFTVFSLSIKRHKSHTCM